VGSEDRKRIADVVQRMRDYSSLSQLQRRRIERLADISWARELDALSRLWPVIPELVEEYLDVMVSALHDFPERDLTGPAPLVAPLIPARA
jgi:hypothetical protein